MNPQKLILNIVILSLMLLTSVMFQGYDHYTSKLGVNLSMVINYKDSEEKNLVWIYFKDKGENSDHRFLNPKNFLTDKSIERRLKRIKNENIFDFTDIPLSNNYLEEILNLGIKIKNKSKWFNAVSCYANKIQIESASRKGFVKKIELVQKYTGTKIDLNAIEHAKSFENFQSDNPADSTNYGPSLNQSSIINVPPVHNNGYSGQEILIASFDAGFDNLQHPCFNLIRSKGIRTYDFVNGDTIVADGLGRKGLGFHGTLTLSLICGYAPGSLVSPAFNAKYILAKTENNQSETPGEEDNWIAAAEWADSLGVDIITSSLGYLNFDPPYTSYTWEQMDGNTAPITRAADLAVHKGIIVVISAGNDSLNLNHNTLNVPADGDSVITVGSVLLNRQRSLFSSVGPTVDGRIKPDVMALGNFNYTARPGAGQTGYTSSNVGTSLACPMVAGVCALVLSANPELTPIQVRDILRSTADNDNQPPNNEKGWGIVNALSAVEMALNFKEIIPIDYQLGQNYPNPFNPLTTFRFALKKEANVSIIVYDISGRMMTTVIDNVFFTSGNKQLKFDFTSAGLSSGVYLYSLSVNGQLIDSKKMILIK